MLFSNQKVHGALLALPLSVSIQSLGLRTEPGRMVAWTLQNFGAYIVENGTPDIYRFSIECGDKGCVKDEFKRQFGLDMQVENGASNDWQHDVSQVLFPLLSVVDSWNATAYMKVKASNGGEGAGGGAPVQPWLPPLPVMPLIPIPTGIGKYVQERGGMCLSLTRNARGRDGRHLSTYGILSLSDCDASMYPGNAWEVAASRGGPGTTLQSVKSGVPTPLAAHSGCGAGAAITASHYGSGFQLNSTTAQIHSVDCPGMCADVIVPAAGSPLTVQNEIIMGLAPCAETPLRFTLTVRGRDASCHEALAAACSTGAERSRSPFVMESCGVCCGHAQRKLKVAGCADEEVASYCGAP